MTFYAGTKRTNIGGRPISGSPWRYTWSTIRPGMRCFRLRIWPNARLRKFGAAQKPLSGDRPDGTSLVRGGPVRQADRQTADHLGALLQRLLPRTAPSAV